jgi:hypothetical protein
MTNEAEPALHLTPLLQGLDAAGASCIAADDRSGRIAIVRGSSVELHALDHSNVSSQASSVLRRRYCPIDSTAVDDVADSARRNPLHMLAPTCMPPPHTPPALPQTVQLHAGPDVASVRIAPDGRLAVQRSAGSAEIVDPATGRTIMQACSP